MMVLFLRLSRPTWRDRCLALLRVSVEGGANKRLFSGAAAAAEDQMLLQQRLNALTGECEWILVAAADDDLQEQEAQADEDDAVRMRLADSLYLDMLNDRRRNSCFDAAIRKSIARSSSRCSHVLDIGSGTGLLSLMASRALQTELRKNSDEERQHLLITCCESYLPMYKLARRILRENNVDPTTINLLHMRSDEIRVGIFMPARADALVCEILDSELLGEGVIPSLRHAHQHLLKPNPITVPFRATMYAQIVECDYLWRCHDLCGVEKELQDGLILSPESYNQFFKYCQYAFHVDALPGLQKLSEPFETFGFDFHKPPDARARVICPVKLNKTGTAHAIVSWWVLQLDEEGTISYSTAPRWIQDGRGWSDHWKQCVWFLPGRGIPVEDQTCIDVVANHDEISVWYDVGDAFSSKDTSIGLKISPERSRMLGDKNRRAAIRIAVQKALRKKDSASCIILDDSLASAVCALTEASEPSHLFAMFPGIKTYGLKYLEGIPGLKLGNICLLQKELKQLTLDDLKGKKIEVLVAEPYYATYEHMLPWKQLRFWYERTMLSPLLADDPVIVPCQGILYGMAYSLPDLWNSRCSLEKVEGFSHTSANRLLGACGNIPDDAVEGPLLPFFTWQCGQQECLSNPFVLLKLDFSREIESVTGFAKVPFAKSGVCHGIVLWMDWVMDSEDGSKLSTGPSTDEGCCWKQGVKLLRKPLIALELQEFDIQASFDAHTGQVSVNTRSNL